MSSPKIILVTGANTGLGLEILKALCRSTTAYTILVGCRTTSTGEQAVAAVSKEYPSTASTLSVIQVDLNSDSSLEQAITTITAEHGKLDILLNNGGAGYDRSIQSGELCIRDGFNKSWDTNVAGTQVLTTLAMPLLLKASDPRLIFMTSGTSTLAETESMASESLKGINSSPPRGWPKGDSMNPIFAYRSSKTGLNMVMREWYRILKNDGVKVWCISPGFLATNLGGFTPVQLKKVRCHGPPDGI